MEDLLSIHEFSKISGVETSTLRYWDDIGLFSPIKRNPNNNYRYYSLAQITSLNFVVVLSDLDFPLKTIAELREERTPEKFLIMLEKQEHLLDKKLRDLRQCYSIIHARRELINYGVRADYEEIGVMWREEKQIILWPRNEYDSEEEDFIKPLTAFASHAASYRINLSLPVGGYYDSMDSFVKGPARPDHFLSLDPTGPQVRPGGDYLVGFSHGYYGDLGDLPERMLEYAKNNSLTISGPVYLLYLHDEICTKDPDNYLAQVCIAVKKSRKGGR